MTHTLYYPFEMITILEYFVTANDGNKIVKLEQNNCLKMMKCTGIISRIYRLLDSLVVECWLRVREVPGSIPSQGPRHTKDVMKNGTSSSLV